MSDHFFRSAEELLKELERQNREEPLGSDASDSEEEEDDLEEFSDHDSESVLDESESDEADTYESQKGNIKWNKEPVRLSNRFTKKDIITSLPGVRPRYKNTENELEAFSYFFSNDVLDIILKNTNKYILLMNHKYKRAQDTKVTVLGEINAVLGLLILAGMYKGAHVNLEELWGVDGPPIFSLAMSLKRFRFILRNLRFDDTQNRASRREVNNLAAVRDIIDIISRKFEQVYSPSEYVTIDEQLIPFRGRCYFRQYLPNKPKSYGIKVFAMVDARSFYLFKFEIYCGKQPDGPYKCSNAPTDIVLRLCQPIINSGRNITTDNWYKNIPMAEKLLENNLTLVGTLRKNKAEIPREFLPSKHRQIHSSYFGFTKKLTMVSYVPKKSKAVIVLSTLHNDKVIDSSSEKNKPEIITFYNSTKGGVDTNDQLCANYNVGRKTNRWPLAVFFHLMNVAGINSYIIFKQNQIHKNVNFKMTRRTFLKNLGHQLLRSHLIARSQCQTILRNLKTKLNSYLEGQGIVILPMTEEATTSRVRKRKRCSVCLSTKDTKYSNFCVKCNNCLCKTHMQIICPNSI